LPLLMLTGFVGEALLDMTSPRCGAGATGAGVEHSAGASDSQAGLGDPLHRGGGL
jgi:hypothetical protein